MKPVLAVAMPVADQLHYLTFDSIMSALSSIPKPWHRISRTDAPVEAARNVLVNGVLNDLPDVTHVLWIDDDMVFDADAIERLLAHDLPIVGGLCHNRRHPYMPILMRKPSADPTTPGYAFMYDYEEEADAKGLVEVDATGAAFILVKREVYEKIVPMLDKEKGEGPYTQKGGGEDVSFCERAKAAGFRIFVDVTVQIGHVGEVVVTEAFARRNRDCFAFPWLPWMATYLPSTTNVEAAAGDAAAEPAPAGTDIRHSGLRVLGNEMDDEGRRHRARYAWAGRKLGRLVKTPGIALDYGCGTGYGCKIMTRTSAEVGGAIIFTGFDEDAEAIAYGQQHWWPMLTANPDEALPLGQTYAAITAFECLEHHDEPPTRSVQKLLGRAPVIVGSMPYKEPTGFNPHHKWAMLDEHFLDGAADAGYRVEFFGQDWRGVIGKLNPDRAVNPIMLFVVRR